MEKNEILSENTINLKVKIKQKLIEYNLIPLNDEIELKPTHNVLINGEWFSHYIINCIHSCQNFFLKIVKDQDGFLVCNRYIQNTYNQYAEYPYPKIVVPQFSFQEMNYYITTYIEGQALDSYSDTLSASIVNHIADCLIILVDNLEQIHASHYSEREAFIYDNYIDNFQRKLELKLQHPLVSNYSHQKLQHILNWSFEILENSQFSQPSLIHMDIKPANIIYNMETGFVSLIDFEFARFGDIDYGWTQLLLSGCNHFNQFYKKQMIPRITNNRLPISEALKIPKYQCYLFYQLLCNMIYYSDRHLSCPKEMSDLFEFFIKKI